MFEAIARGEIKALWVIGTNPAVSMPDADAARAALGKLELLVISENVRSNDTVKSGAHVLLPAQAWGEKSGTVTNSERRISRQRAFLESPGEAKPDWWIVERGGKAARLCDGLQFQFGGGCVPRTRSTFGVREQWRPRFRYRRAEILVGRGVRRDGAGAVAGTRGRAGAGALVCRRKFPCQRPQGPLHRAGNSGIADRDERRTAAAAEHRPYPGSMAHHDPHRHEPAAGPASAGAVRRGASRRRPEIRRVRRRLRAHHHRLRAMHPQGRCQRTPAARHAVCADPLERRHRVRRARRRAGRALHRSVFRSAREQGDAGLDGAV